MGTTIVYTLQYHTFHSFFHSLFTPLTLDEFIVLYQIYMLSNTLITLQLMVYTLTLVI